MIIGGIELNPKLEKMLGAAGCRALKQFVAQQKARGRAEEWDGVSFEAGWRARRQDLMLYVKELFGPTFVAKRLRKKKATTREGKHAV